MSLSEMDPLDFLDVRFHFGREFINDGKALHYCGGKEGVSSIERDKISLPEITRHLKDHFQPSDPILLHWLFPGKQLVDGLRALVDDKSCKVMCDSITDRGVAEVYVELVIVDDKELDTEGSDWEVEATKEGFVRIISSPEKIQKDVAAARKYCEWIRQTKGKEKAVVVESNSENDSDYNPGDDETSEDDDEAAHIRNELKELKKKLKAGCLVLVDGEGQQVNAEGLTASNAAANEQTNDDSDTPYFDSDEDDSYDEGPDGELHRKKKSYPTFESNANVPSFTVGMAFSEKQDFRLL